MKVVGIDPSLTATGIATVYGTTFTSKGGKGDARLVRLYEDVLKTAREADLAVIEDLPKQAMGAGLTGRAQGVVRLALQRCDVPYVAVVPSTLKKFATGSGRADKELMLEHMLIQRRMRCCLVDGVLVAMDKSLDDNQVDAWWLREIGLAKLAGKEVPAAIDWTGWEIAL